MYWVILRVKVAALDLFSIYTNFLGDLIQFCAFSYLCISPTQAFPLTSKLLYPSINAYSSYRLPDFSINDNFLSSFWGQIPGVFHDSVLYLIPKSSQTKSESCWFCLRNISWILYCCHSPLSHIVSQVDYESNLLTGTVSTHIPCCPLWGRAGLKTEVRSCYCLTFPPYSVSPSVKSHILTRPYVRWSPPPPLIGLLLFLFW